MESTWQMCKQKSEAGSCGCETEASEHPGLGLGVLTLISSVRLKLSPALSILPPILLLK